MRLNRARPHKANHLSPAEGPIHLGEDLRLRRAGGRASEGNPRTNCVADDRHRRPLADRGSPGRTHGTAVTNPRIRVCSTVVLTALPPAPRTRSSLPQPVPDNGMANPRPPSLTTNIREFMRENWISNRTFASYRDILEHCCAAWNKLTDQPWIIMSIGLRDWANA